MLAREEDKPTSRLLSSDVFFDRQQAVCYRERMKIAKDLREYFREIGRKGGKAKTPAKRRSAKLNVAKAREAKITA